MTKANSLLVDYNKDNLSKDLTGACTLSVTKTLRALINLTMWINLLFPVVLVYCFSIADTFIYTSGIKFQIIWMHPGFI